MDDINLAKKRKQDNEDARIEYYCLMSMYDIKKGSTKCTTSGIVLFKLNTLFFHV